MASSRAHKMAKGQYSTGGAVGRAMRTMRRHYADGGDVVKDRAMFLPLGTYGDGTTRAAWPGLLHDSGTAIKRLVDHFYEGNYRPGDRDATRRLAEDSFTAASVAPVGGLVAGAVRGRMPRATLSSNAADDAAKRLPMDEASRMARAREMGFDTDTTWYHGTKSPDFDRFDLKRAGKSDPGLVGRAVYFTPEAEQAGSFALSQHYGKGDAPAVLPAHLRMENPAYITDGVLPDGRRLTEAHPTGITKESAASLRRALAAAGHDGVIFKNADGELMQAAVFDPSRIRSTRATFDPDQIDSTNLLAANTSKASAPGLGALEANRVRQSLPMDEASRMARAREMGYADDAFYRGEVSGKAPTEYGFGHFSRDQEYAEGFAKRGGFDAPREFRLNLGNAFVDYQPVTASQYAKILNAVAADNPKLANNMLGQLTDKGMDWFKGYVERYPDRPVVESGALVRAGLGSHDDALRYIKAAGFGSIDSGRDVVKLTGDGIRLKDAKFDPKKAASKNILAANRGAVPVVPSDPTED